MTVEELINEVHGELANARTAPLPSYAAISELPVPAELEKALVYGVAAALLKKELGKRRVAAAYLGHQTRIVRRFLG